MLKKIAFMSLTATLAVGCGGGTTPTTPDSGTGYTPTGTGPAAHTYCKSSGKNAFDTYGATAFVAVNKSIIAKTLADKSGNLGNSFSKIGDKSSPAYNADAAAFEGKLAAFLVYAYGGPTSITYTDGKTYNGVQDMKAAHVGMGITSAQYDYFVANQVVPALTDNGVPVDDVTSCFAPAVGDLKGSIVGQ